MSASSALWLTYAWADNRDQDVDFIAQELRDAGVEVQLDRVKLGAGVPLWPQIEQQICDPTQSGAWAMYVTTASLASNACQEELLYARNRALTARGERFPLIGLSPGWVDDAVIPIALKVRLYVRTSDPDWVERVCAAIAGQIPAIEVGRVKPIAERLYRRGELIILEVRPRAGLWVPCHVVVPAPESDLLQAVFVGPRGTGTPMMVNVTSIASNDGSFLGTVVDAPAVTPENSLYVVLKNLPSELKIVVEGMTIRYTRERMAEMPAPPG